MKDEPNLEMLNAKIFGHMNEYSSKKSQLSEEAVKLREQMIGYVDALIVRQDRTDVFQKFESMQVESSSRRVLKDLVDHYGNSLKQQSERVEGLKGKTIEQSQKIGNQD